MSRSAEMLDRRDALVAALEGLQRGQHKISISAVARKAGVTPALIHNTYPDVAERIRAISGRDVSALRGKENAILKSFQADNKRLHQDNAQLNADVARLASIVQTLTNEVARLRALSTGQVVEMGKQSNR